MQNHDVVIIGAGLMGCFTARSLAVRGYRVALLERENDVSMGISRANSAIVYAGYDMKPSTLKAELTVQGNADFADLCQKLNVDYKRPGSLMMACGSRGERVLKSKLEQGLQNGVPGLRLLDSAEVQELEPGVSAAVSTALYAPTTGTVNPWQLCLAAAEDAVKHGALLYLDHEVVALERKALSGSEHGYLVRCANEHCLCAPVVINCAGVEADKVHELVAPVEFRLALSSGSYLMLDGEPQAQTVPSHKAQDAVAENAQSNLLGTAPRTTQSSLTNSTTNSSPRDYPAHIVFYEPEEKHKGATFVPTIDGTLLLGPSHEELSFEELDFLSREPGYLSSSAGLDYVRARSLEVFPALPLERTIRNFGTLRPHIHWARRSTGNAVVLDDESIHDFHIAWARECPGLLTIAGIKTPGLTCANSIGRYAAGLVEAYLAENNLSKERLAGENHVKIDTNKSGCSPAWAQAQIQAQTPQLHEHDDHEIICRCRHITYGEVRRALRVGGGARTVDGIKRRTEAGMGRCQGGFCLERVMLVLAEELGCCPTDIMKDRAGSWIARARSADNNHEVLTRSAPCPKQPAHASEGSTPAFLPQRTRLLVIGGGAAGLAAACAAHKAGIPAHEILLVDRLGALGGILPQCLHRGFGVRRKARPVSGPEYLTPLLREFSASGIPSLLNTMATSCAPSLSVSLAGPGGITELEPEALILATGCRERPFGALPIAGARPSGILTAGAAQRMVNLQHWDIGDRIVILGSGDVGMIMAGTLAQQGKHVVALIEQASRATGLATNRTQYIDAHAIPLRTHSVVSQVFGQRRIEGVEIRDLTTQRSRRLNCDALIVSVGMIPETDLLQVLLSPPGDSLDSLSHGSLSCFPGVILAGNARTVHRFIESVVADGSAAGKRSAAYVLGA